jgi:sigma-B regulation protein RsbU (phosphoserine phosphatase)
LSEHTLDSVPLRCKSLINLSKRLVTHQDTAQQRDLITEIVASEMHARVSLWLPDALQRLHAAEPGEAQFRDNASELIQRAIDTRQTVTAPNDHPGIVLAVATPLLIRDELLGVLEVERDADAPLDAIEIKLLDCVASQIAVVLQSTQQLAIERWRGEQLELVREVSRKIASILDLDQLATIVVGLIRRTFDYYYVALFGMDAEQGILHMLAAAGPEHLQPREAAMSSLTAVPLGKGLIGHVGQAGTEIVAHDVSKEPRYRHVDALPNTRAEVALPLRVEGRLLGVLDVQSDRPQGMHELDLVVLRALAENIAVAMEHARTCQHLRRRADEFAVISQVNRAAASDLDQDILLTKIARLIQQQFDYPFVHLFTIDTAQRRVVHKASSGRDQVLYTANDHAFSLEDEQDIIPWVAGHGETVIENSIRDGPRFPESPLRPHGVLSELAVPLIFSGQTLGVLDVQSDRQDAFGMDDYFLFRALADSIAIALRNANLYRSERWRRQVADSMREVAGLLSSDLVLEEVLDAILSELDRTLPCDIAAICQLEDEVLRIAAVQGASIGLDIGEFPSDASPWITETLSADGPVIHPGEGHSDPIASALGFGDDYSAIAAPLRAGGRQFGLLYLAHRAAGRYGSESEIIMSAFANYAAVAIENTRVYQASQEQALLSTVMLQVAEATQSLTTLDEVLEAIVRLVAMLVRIDRCAILLWDPQNTAYVPAVAHGLSAQQQERFARWHVGLDEIVPFSDLLINRSPLVVHDLETDARLSKSTLSTLGFESLLAIPLLAQGESLGTMLVDYRDDAFTYDTLDSIRDERLSIIQAIAYQAAAAIDNAQLREAQQQEAYVSAALLQVAQTVANLSDIDDILSAIVRITPILVGVEHCVLFLWDEEHGAFQPSHAYGLPREAEDTLMNYRYAPGDFGLLDATRARDSTVIRTYSPSAPEAQDWLPSDFAALVGYLQGETRTLMGFPLSVKGEMLGVMMLEEAQVSASKKEKRLELITGITQQAALALQNEQLQQARLGRERLDRELQLAHEIQETFMPDRIPEMPGWEIAAIWRAARQVAGDFYDLIEQTDGKLGLVIADVADKGMPAALFMTLTRTLLRATVREESSHSQKPPSDVLAQVNDLLVPDTRRGMFVTAFYAVLSPQDGHLDYANAGHNSPLVLRAGSGQIERLNRGGMALGVVTGTRAEDHSTVLNPGDCIVLYTDGVTEATSPQGELYGSQRLRELLLSTSRQTAQGILDQIDSAVRKHIGAAPPSDDLTLIVLRRLERDRDNRP